MLNNNPVPANERQPEYEDKSEITFTPPFSRETFAPAEHEKMLPSRRRSRTRVKMMATIILLVLLFGGGLCIFQNISIQQRQYDIQGKIGDVWNEVDRASQLLQQDAALLNATIASQNHAIAQIAQARGNVAAIKANQGTSDPNGALSAANQMNSGIRFFVESYPDYGVGSNTHSVLIQIEGSFNRIEYARTQLIAAQTDFNKWLLTQIPMNMLYHPVQILGSNTNPAAPAPVPTYTQPTP